MITVSHTLDELERDLRTIARNAKKDLPRVVRMNTKRGNRIAQAYATEQHTMFGDEDITYAPSFTWEMIGPLTGEYGPDAAIGDGSKASGYEHGSINSPGGHHNLARSTDQVGPMFARDVAKVAARWFWP